MVNLGNLQFSYADNTTFTWQEDFEQVNLSIESTSKSEVNFVRTQMTAEFDTVFPYESNNYAAKVVIPNDTVLFECASHDSFVLPTDGHYVFMELNYKSNNPFTMGLLINGSVTSQRSVLVVNPSKTWNKIYINLTPSISANNGASSFKIFLAAMKSTSDATAEIYFDNIKLLHD